MIGGKLITYNCVVFSTTAALPLKPAVALATLPALEKL